MISYRNQYRRTLTVGFIALSLLLIAGGLSSEFASLRESRLHTLSGNADIVHHLLLLDVPDEQISLIIASLFKEGEGLAIVDRESAAILLRIGDISNTDIQQALGASDPQSPVAQSAGVNLDDFQIWLDHVERMDTAEFSDHWLIATGRAPISDLIFGNAANFVAITLLALWGGYFILRSQAGRFLLELSRFSAQPDENLISNSFQEIQGLASAFNRFEEAVGGEMGNLKDSLMIAQAVLGKVRDGVILLNRAGKVAFINREAASMFNTEPEAAVGESLAQVVYSHRVVDLWKAYLVDGSVQPEEIYTRRGNRILEISFLPLGMEMKDFALLTIQDVTRQKELEVVRRDFVSNVSHELRTPISSIKALSETLQEGALNDPSAARRFLERIDVEVDALFQLVTELMTLSRIESGQDAMVIQSLHPCELGEIAIARLQAQAARREVALKLTCLTEQRANLDKERTLQLLVNLVHNAIKFTQPGGAIELRIEPEQEGVAFVVEDNGIGIPESDLPRVFERFYKGDRSRSGGGTGLGLAIAKHIVESQGGTISVSSIEGKGSTFKCIFPHRPLNP